jgi:Domain of unknown function DUF29
METFKNKHNQIYEQEYDRWLENQVAALKNRHLDQLDYDNLIEELEDLGNERKSAVESYARRIIEHLLYCEYWIDEQGRNKRHWQHEIVVFRAELESRLTTNLRKHLDVNLVKLYKKAKLAAEIKSSLQMPDKVYTLQQILDDDFLP